VADYLTLPPQVADPDNLHPGLDLEYLRRLGLQDRLPAWREIACQALAQSKAA
jgi:hypothetical protein